jgi:hypothetical protein
MKISILEFDATVPKCQRPKSFCIRLIERELADAAGDNAIRLRKGVTLPGLGQMLSSFELKRETWYPSFNIKFDPLLRESPGLKYPLLLARRQQSFTYDSAAFA